MDVDKWSFKTNFSFQRFGSYFVSVIVFISEYDCFWGVTPENEIMFKKSSNESSWEKIVGTLSQISVSELGVFGTDSNAKYYYRVGTNNNPTSSGWQWQL